VTMWSFADRITKTVSDLTVGTVIVLFHVALADRHSRQHRRELGDRNAPSFR
jgi:hypothetical protein